MKIQKILLSLFIYFLFLLTKSSITSKNLKVKKIMFDPADYLPYYEKSIEKPATEVAPAVVLIDVSVSQSKEDPLLFPEEHGEKPVVENSLNVEQRIEEIFEEDYLTFMSYLGENIKDPEFRKAIRSLAKKKYVNFGEIKAPANRMLPTQNEIDLEKSLKSVLTDIETTRNILKCEEPFKLGGHAVVTSYNGRYIIDGHHIWSQVFTINPKCSMAAFDLHDVEDPFIALMSTQLGIAAGVDKNGNEIETIPISHFRVEDDLFKISEVALKNYVTDNITEDVLKVFQEFDHRLNKKEKVANFIWGNIKRMQTYNFPIDGAPTIGYMPHTSKVLNWCENLINIE